MSAIAGIIRFDGAPIEPGLIEKLTGAMKARGPDAQTHWMRGVVALGHCMLRTTPESLEERQPLVSQDRGLVLVWDGRLDNREELQLDLKIAGAILRDDSDAELALHGYAVWGEDCPKRLLGDFAFAVWDTRSQRLFCARDHVGARPFYFTNNDRFFAFASEDEPLLELPGIRREPNKDRLTSILVPAFFSCCDARQSWLEDVRKVGAGQYLIVEKQGAVKSTQFWQLEPRAEARYVSDSECQEAFLEVFGNAVRCRMRTTGDVAAMMSGGLDSASIAGMVRRLLRGTPDKAFHTYSAISDHPENCVESRCIKKITQDMGEHAHFLSVPSFAGMSNLPELLDIAWSRAQPVDNSILLQAMMCSVAAKDGHRVLLHGASGDLATCFPDYYSAFHLRRGHLQWAWRECRAASRNHLSLKGKSPFRLLLRNIWAAMPPVGLKLLLYGVYDVTRESPLANGLINADFARRQQIKERLRQHRDSARLDAVPDLQRMQAKSLFPQLMPNGLEGCERVAGRFGVELRDPWADRRVLEFFIALPLEYKVRLGWTKYLIRTSFAADLEPEILWRNGKEHLGWNFASRAISESRVLLDNIAASSFGPLAAFIDLAAADKMTKSYCAYEEDGDAEMLYWLVTLSLWLNRIQKDA